MVTSNTLVEQQQGDKTSTSETSATSGQGKCAKWFFRIAGVAGEEVTSGQTPLQMAQFSVSLTGPFLSSVALAAAREYYTLIFGANASAMGTAFLVVSFWGPLIYPFIGYIQDKQVLATCFPLSTWGRRAPWFLVNLVGLSCCSTALYLPPSQEPVNLVLWLVPVLVLGQFCLVNIFVSFESSRAELYPMKGERILTESMIKVAVGVGSGIGGALMIVLLGDAPIGLRLIISFLIGLLTLVSLMAVPIFRRAKTLADKELIGNLLREWASVAHIDAVQQLSLLKFWQGAFESTVITFVPYHLTIVARLVGAERQGFIALAALVVLGVEAALLPLLTRKFRSDKWDMQRFCGWAHAICAPAAPALLAFLPLDEEWKMMAYILLLRMCFAPQTYFRTNALCWLVDEDCYKMLGRRREGTFIGICNFVGSIGRAAAAGFLFYGLTLAGLETSTCLQDCEHEPSDSQAHADCVEMCELANVNLQPPDVKTYIRVMFYAVAPFCQVMSALHIFLFPIKGVRLRQLCEQAKSNSKMKAEVVGSRTLAPDDEDGLGDVSPVETTACVTKDGCAYDFPDAPPHEPCAEEQVVSHADSRPEGEACAA